MDEYEYEIDLAEEAGLDLADLDPSPDEVAALLDVLSEADTYNGHDPDQDAAEWAASLSDNELDEMLASYEADTALPGPELAGADSGNVIDLAAEMSQVDIMLASMTDREHQRQVQDAAEAGRRRGSTEVRLSNAMRRLDAGTYVYGQEPAVGLAADPDIDGLFSTGPSLNAAEVADRMRYELKGGAKPQGRGEFRPPVRDLATRIGLR